MKPPDFIERDEIMNNRHITLPAGFKAAATACGIKKNGKNDLAVIAADTDTSAAIVTTSNQIFGAPIEWDRQILPKGFGKIRAMVINAGNSNVCTGKEGVRNAKTMAARADLGIIRMVLGDAGTFLFKPEFTAEGISDLLYQLDSTIQELSNRAP